MKKRDMLRHELIGRAVRVIDAKNRHLKGLSGTITDETKNMLVVDGKKLIKEQITFMITDSNIVIEGREIALRPEDRIKKLKADKIKPKPLV